MKTENGINTSAVVNLVGSIPITTKEAYDDVLYKITVATSAEIQ
jgi:hypothetical protein